MPLRIDIYAFIIFLGIVQGLFLVVVFLSHHRANRANLYSALFILVLCLISLEILFNYTRLTREYLFLLDFSEPLNFLIAPLFYLGLRQQLLERDSNHWLHFAPAAIYFLYAFLFWFQNGDFKAFTYLSAYDPVNAHMPASQPFPHDPWKLKANLMELTITQMVLYFLLTLRMSRSADFNLRGVSKAVLFKRVLALSLGFILIIIFVRNYFDADLGDHFLAVSTAVFIYYLSFLVYTRSTALRGSFGYDKYTKSAIGDADKTRYKQRILDKLEHDQVYLDSGLNLARFSKMVKLPVNQVSQIVNECFALNFNELINSHRVRAAQQKILQPENHHLKIEAIGYQCGFNSKSAFYTAFKKFTGESPSAFRDRAKASEL